MESSHIKAPVDTDIQQNYLIRHFINILDFHQPRPTSPAYQFQFTSSVSFNTVCWLRLAHNQINSLTMWLRSGRWSLYHSRVKPHHPFHTKQRCSVVTGRENYLCGHHWSLEILYITSVLFCKEDQLEQRKKLKRTTSNESIMQKLKVTTSFCHTSSIKIFYIF